MKDFYELSLTELKTEIGNIYDYNRVLRDILRTIFQLKNNMLQEGELNPDYTNITETPIIVQLRFIESFIYNTYPEKLLREIKESRKDCDIYIEEKQKELAKAFEALAAREAKLNKDIQDHLTKNDQK